MCNKEATPIFSIVQFTLWWNLIVVLNLKRAPKGILDIAFSQNWNLELKNVHFRISLVFSQWRTIFDIHTAAKQNSSRLLKMLYNNFLLYTCIRFSKFIWKSCSVVNVALYIIFKCKSIAGKPLLVSCYILTMVITNCSQ